MRQKFEIVFTRYLQAMGNLVRSFIYSAGCLLLATAIAKFISASGSASILHSPDPILSIKSRYVLCFLGAIEFAIGLICAFSKRQWLQAGLIAWLATNFLLYRLGLEWIGHRKPCSCLGNLTDALHISSQTADVAMKIILAYLLIGSYTSLLWLWCQRKSTAAPATM